MVQTTKPRGASRGAFFARNPSTINHQRSTINRHQPSTPPTTYLWSQPRPLLIVIFSLDIQRAHAEVRVASVAARPVIGLLAIARRAGRNTARHRNAG